MGPKPQNNKKAQGIKVSATSKAVDDFLAQTTVPAGMLERQENDKKQREKQQELKEKYMTLVAPGSIQLNNESLNRCRVISNIFSGISAGIMGYGGGAGFLWWIGANLAVSILIYLRIQTLGKETDGSSKYFNNPVTEAFAGVMSNLMTYLLFWIMFYNIVYVIW